jgi:hypothetical protein
MRTSLFAALLLTGAATLLPLAPAGAASGFAMPGLDTLLTQQAEVIPAREAAEGPRREDRRRDRRQDRRQGAALGEAGDVVLLLAREASEGPRREDRRRDRRQDRRQGAALEEAGDSPFLLVREGGSRGRGRGRP